MIGKIGDGLDDKFHMRIQCVQGFNLVKQQLGVWQKKDMYGLQHAMMTSE
jgi:hypothetical protein